MRAVVQRVSSGRVTVDGRESGAIGRGLLLLVGVAQDDTPETAARCADRCAGLRIFSDQDGKMNLALRDVEGAAILAVSNFTVYGDAAKGRRPSFVRSAPYERGRELFGRFCDELRRLGVTVAEGEFGADMRVELVNDGPVTLIVEVEPT